MKVAQDPVKIDPPWKRFRNLALGVIALPLAIFALGLLIGAAWWLATAGFHIVIKN